METIYERTQMLLGADMLKKIRSKKIVLFGIGGVGGYAAEALARVGIGTIGIVDDATIDLTEINRQITALHSTVGKKKTEVMQERILDINPEAEVRVMERLNPENVNDFNLKGYDYIIDAMDDIPSKLLLIKEAVRHGVPVVSAMGTGNRFDPLQLKIGPINKAGACPMAKLMKKELDKMGIRYCKVLFSTEDPHREELPDDDRRVPSSISFVPSAAGILIASEVVRDIIYAVPSDKMIFGIKKPASKIRADF